MQSKEEIRQVVWDELTSQQQGAFPFPLHGRTPNFKGADIAAKQLVEAIPQEKFDVPPDIILSHKELIRTKTRREKPKGIYWENITKEMFKGMPVLKKMKQLNNEDD